MKIWDWEKSVYLIFEPFPPWSAFSLPPPPPLPPPGHGLPPPLWMWGGGAADGGERVVEATPRPPVGCAGGFGSPSLHFDLCGWCIFERHAEHHRHAKSIAKTSNIYIYIYIWFWWGLVPHMGNTKFQGFNHTRAQPKSSPTIHSRTQPKP